jgi:CRP/FNR family transcriptional regulator, anaerobic regulatory protein
MYQTFETTGTAGTAGTLPRVAPLARNTETGVRVRLDELARLLSLDVEALGVLAEETFTTRRVHAGESVLLAGDRFEALYVVRSGFLKTVAIDESGGMQVMGFPMTGDVLGVDGLDNGSHTAEVIALDEVEVVIVPFARLARMARICPAVEHLVYRTLSRELVREQRALWMLGSLGAEARVAAFLLNLADRFAGLGYSRTRFNLRMTRQEIGSYLGLKLETVSRALSAFDANGVARVHQKSIELLRPEALRAQVANATHA